MNYYEILGVDNQATAEQIKQAYRRLASKFHPDKGGDKERFQEIQQAYAVLSDPQQRPIYDDPGSQARGMNQPHFNINDIFQMFGARFHGNGESMQRSTRMMLNIGLSDVCRGGRRVVSLATPQGQATVEIELPVGLDDGDTLRYSRAGPMNADLVITFRVHAEPGWQRQGSDLILDQRLLIWDLILGNEVLVDTLYGTRVRMTIPPMTQPGTLLRLRGQGIPDRHTRQPGDLFVRCLARLPDDITAEQMIRIRDLAGR